MSVVFHNIEMEKTGDEIYQDIDNPGDEIYMNDNVQDNPPSKEQQPHNILLSALLAQLSTLEARLNATERHNAVSSDRKCSSWLPVVATALLGLLLLAGITVGAHSLTTIDMRLTASERQNEALLAQLSTQEMGLNASEQQNAANLTQLSMSMRLISSESQVEELSRHNAAMSDRLRTVEDMVEDLKREVAFSAGLGHQCPYGPFSNENNVVYNRVFANVGDAYDPDAGVFVAPVPGTYYFTFTASHQYRRQNVFVKMYKNSQMLFDNYGYNDHPGWEYITNSIMLPLVQGDRVYMRLPKDMRLCGEPHNHFSGFLI